MRIRNQQAISQRIPGQTPEVDATGTVKRKQMGEFQRRDTLLLFAVKDSHMTIIAGTRQTCLRRIPGNAPHESARQTRLHLPVQDAIQSCGFRDQPIELTGRRPWFPTFRRGRRVSCRLTAVHSCVMIVRRMIGAGRTRYRSGPISGCGPLEIRIEIHNRNAIHSRCVDRCRIVCDGHLMFRDIFPSNPTQQNCSDQHSDEQADSATRQSRLRF
jgi:hypothetical protein